MGNLQQVAIVCVKTLWCQLISFMWLYRYIKQWNCDQQNVVSVAREKKTSTHNRRHPLMAAVAPACWDDTSKAMHNVSTQVITEILLLSHCSFWLILFWIKVLLSPLWGVVPHIASVGAYASPFRLDNSVLPSSTSIHRDTHTTHEGRKNKMQRLTSWGNACGRGWLVEC